MQGDVIHPTLARALRHHQAGRIAEAEVLYRELLARDQRHVDALHLLGVACRRQKRVAEAVDLFQRAIALLPDFGEAHYNLGNALRDLGRIEAAADAYGRAVICTPTLARAHFMLGNMRQTLGRTEDSLPCYHRSLEISPDVAAPCFSLGLALQQLGRFDEAAAFFRRAVALDPSHTNAVAHAHYLRQHMCDWEDWETGQTQVLSQVWAGHRLSPFIVLAQKSDGATQLKAARQWAATFDHLAAWRPSLGFTGRRGGGGAAGDSGDRIAVGYLSADFQEHATSLLMAELFELHDRRRFHVSAYSFGADDGGPLRRRIVAACDRFVDIRPLGYVEAARRINADGIDILVDLKGYTLGARTEIMALRPAPVQVNWLGYPGTMGADFIDYIIADPFLVPPETAGHLGESQILLPDCYQINDRRRAIAPDRPTRAACGLPEDGTVFAAFNSPYKITPEVFDTWMRILAAVPGGVLWQLDANGFAADNLRREAAARDIDPERLVFAKAVSPAEHLARLHLADLALDTFPVNGHTTTSDALWAGCPVVTLAGDTFAARVAGSLLRAAGLPDLVTTNLLDYEALAQRLGGDRDALAEVRRRLAANRATCPLFDSPRFTRNLEAAYELIWRRYRQQQPEGGGATAPPPPPGNRG